MHFIYHRHYLRNPRYHCCFARFQPGGMLEYTNEPGKKLILPGSFSHVCTFPYRLQKYSKEIILGHFSLYLSFSSIIGIKYLLSVSLFHLMIKPLGEGLRVQFFHNINHLLLQCVRCCMGSFHPLGGQRAVRAHLQPPLPAVTLTGLCIGNSAMSSVSVK